MKVIKIIFLLLFFPSLVARGQDERLFRRAVLGAFAPKSEETKLPTKFNFRANSDMYRIDLTGDGYKEGIVFEKIDSENWLHIHDNFMRRIASFSFEAKGIRAHPYKLILSRVSKTIRILQVYFYEGYIRGMDFHGTARLYLLTYRNNDLSTLTLSKGPQFFLEAREDFGHYYIKRFNIEFKDLDFDGTKELVVAKHMMSMVYVLNYKTLLWKNINNHLN